MKPETKERLKRKWLTYAIAGLLLCGFGLSLFGEAIIIKASHGDTWVWVGVGTLALVVFNSGLCLVVRAGTIDHKIRELDN
jgi:hypothetical protein